MGTSDGPATWRSRLNGLKATLTSTASGARASYQSSMKKGLNTTVASRNEHITAMRRAVEDDNVSRVHDWIHQNLTILDGKVQSILSLYSIALAALTILFTDITASASTPILVLLLIGFGLVIWAIWPLARISFVYWSATEEFEKPEVLLEDLLRVRDRRTVIIRRSLMKGPLIVAVFVILVAWDVVHHASAAS